MPIPAALLALIPPLASAGSSMLGARSSANAQRDINTQNLAWANYSLRQQREWALQDWDKVNEYNSPQQQMQRFKEAGLNPHLIYGNANNSPASMVRQTDIKAPNLDAGGFINAANMASNAFGDAMNSYMGYQKLQNDTRLIDAQILNLKANADKTSLDNEVTRKAFNDLIMTPWFKNQKMATEMEYTDKKRNTLPDHEMAMEKYLSEIAKNDAQGKHALELFKLAQQEGILKQADIDTLERMSASPMGVRLIMDFLKMILGLKKPF